MELEIVNKALLRKVRSEWAPHHPGRLASEQYRPYLEYAERVLTLPSKKAWRHVYALVDDSDNALIKYPVLSMSASDPAGVEIGYSWRLFHPVLQDHSRTDARDDYMTCFIQQAVGKAMAQQASSVAIKLECGEYVFGVFQDSCVDTKNWLRIALIAEAVDDWNEPIQEAEASTRGAAPPPRARPNQGRAHDRVRRHAPAGAKKRQRSAK